MTDPAPIGPPADLLAHAVAARGFMPTDEGNGLWEAGLEAGAAVPGAPFLEIGSYCGKSSLWLGGAAIWDTGMGEVSLKLQGDALGHSKGFMASLDYEKRFEFGALAVAPRLGVRHVDRKYVDYYFGVKPTEARTDRPAYLGRSTLQTEGGLRFTYASSRNESWFLDVSGRLLGSAVEDSPLVERSYQASLFAGWMYRF